MSDDIEVAKLINEASDDSDEILISSAKCIGALVNHSTGHEKHVMKDYPVLVVGHALITCAGYYFEKWQTLNNKSQKGEG